MPDEFGEVLERLDVQFSDFDTMDELIQRLDSVLSLNQARASIDQIAIAFEKLEQERSMATAIGATIGRFMRSGRTVTQLRDSRGRFVASTERFLRDGKTIVLGQGDIRRYLEENL